MPANLHEFSRLKVLVSETFEFDQIVDAHRALEANKHVGRIVVKV